MNDGHLPHQFPKEAPDEVLGWRCVACGEWIGELSGERTDCSVDWRHRMTMPAPMTREDRLLAALRALVEAIDVQSVKSDGGPYVKLAWISAPLFDARAVLYDALDE